MQDILMSSVLENNLAHTMAPILYSVSTMHRMTVSLALTRAAPVQFEKDRPVAQDDEFDIRDDGISGQCISEERAGCDGKEGIHGGRRRLQRQQFVPSQRRRLPSGFFFPRAGCRVGRPNAQRPAGDGSVHAAGGPSAREAGGTRRRGPATEFTFVYYPCLKEAMVARQKIKELSLTEDGKALTCDYENTTIDTINRSDST
eukprot:550929_1